MIGYISDRDNVKWYIFGSGAYIKADSIALYTEEKGSFIVSKETSKYSATNISSFKATMYQGEIINVKGYVIDINNEKWYMFENGGYIKAKYVEKFDNFVNDKVHVASSQTSIRTEPCDRENTNLVTKIRQGNVLNVKACVKDKNGKGWYLLDKGTYVKQDDVIMIESYSKTYVSNTEVDKCKTPYENTYFSTLPSGSTIDIVGYTTNINNEEWYMLESGAFIRK